MHAHSAMLCWPLTGFAYACSSPASSLARRGTCTYFRRLLARLLVSKRVGASFEYGRGCSFLNVSLVTDVYRQGHCGGLRSLFDDFRIRLAWGWAGPGSGGLSERFLGFRWASSTFGCDCLGCGQVLSLHEIQCFHRGHRRPGDLTGEANWSHFW